MLSHPGRFDDPGRSLVVRAGVAGAVFQTRYDGAQIPYSERLPNRTATLTLTLALFAWNGNR